MPQERNYNRNTLKRSYLSDVERSSKRRARTMSPSASDDGRTLKSTVIDGHRIACFVVGGEPRLCLPQLLRLVVDRVDVEQVESTRNRLSVNLAQCDSDQLTVLHEAGVLPASVSSCGLVTLSDAARLVSGLSEFLRRDELIDEDRKWSLSADSDVIDSERMWTSSSDDRKSAWLPSAVDVVTDHNRKWIRAQSVYDDVIDRDRKWSPLAAEFCDELPVCHSCFGGCSGTLSRRRYVSVRCDECSAILSPEVFVTHTHRLDAESLATCHWGFDSAHWRHYVILNATAVTSAEVNRRLQAALDDVKQLHDYKFPVKPIPVCREVNLF